ncbi:hypothetical protein G6F60_015550 [Rhizopus arrhizus]|nr:hypothetical protein G6F60_015550 [Rhizopus arrhizus]
MAGRVFGVVAEVRVRQGRHPQAPGRLPHGFPTPGRRGDQRGADAAGLGQPRRPRACCPASRCAAPASGFLYGSEYGLGSGSTPRAMGAALCRCRHAGRG